jgi:hypothetical protein
VTTLAAFPYKTNRFSNLARIIEPDMLRIVSGFFE